MGKATRQAPRPAVTGIDATPERLAKEDSDIVNALRENPRERMGKVRKFRAAHLDRYLASGSITYAQWYAGDWYRQQHHRCAYPLRVVAGYGQSAGAGEHPGSFGYGLPRQEAQARAREVLKKARAVFPRDMIGFMERFLVHDELPRYGGRAAMRSMDSIRRSLDLLVDYIG